MRSSIGGGISSLGALFWFLLGAVAFIVNIKIVFDVWGLFGALVGLFIFPIVIAAAPWYALIALDNAIPVIITYGGGLLGVIIMMAGAVISGGD